MIRFSKCKDFFYTKEENPNLYIILKIDFVIPP